MWGLSAYRIFDKINDTVLGGWRVVVVVARIIPVVLAELTIVCSLQISSKSEEFSGTSPVLLKIIPTCTRAGLA